MKLSLCGGVICLLLLSAGGGPEAAENLVSPSHDGIIYSPSRKFSINYAPRRLEGFEVELWYAYGDGGEWQLHGTDEDGETPIAFEAERDGIYLLHLRAVTDSTTVVESLSFEPQMSVAVDTQGPLVKMLSPSVDQVFQRGESIPIEWETADANAVENGVEIRYLGQSDQDWRVAATGLGTKGSYGWQPPAGTLGMTRLRIRAMDKAANWGEAAVSVVIGGIPPEVFERMRGPETSTTREVGLDFQSRSAKEELELWVTDDGGDNWRKYGVFAAEEDGATFLAPEDGVYGFRLVESGKEGLPDGGLVPGTRPEFECMVDTTPPEVSLLSPIGGESWHGGEERKVLWRASDENLPQRPISLYYAADGGIWWDALARGLENSGEYVWGVPRVASATSLVKVEVRDLAGNVSEATSPEFFTVEISPSYTEAMKVGDRPSLWRQVEDEPIAPTTDSTVATRIVSETIPDAVTRRSARELETEAAQLRAGGHLAEAELLLREAHEDFPEDVRLTNDLGAILVALHKYDEAVKLLSTSEHASDHEMRYNLGMAFQRSGDLPSALQQFRAALELDPGSTEIRWAVAGTLVALGRPEEAKILWEGLAKDETLPEAWRRKARKLSESVSQQSR